MKTTKVLTAVSAAALLGISSVALAQQGGSSGGGAGSSGAPPANTMQKQQDAPPAGSMSQDKGGMKSNQAQDKGSPKSTTTGQSQMDKDTPKAAQGKDSQKSTTGQSQMGKDQKSTSGQMGKDSQPSQAQSPATDSKSQATSPGSKDSTVGAASSGGVNLTTEQRTTLRTSVLTSSAPRVNNVNFSINVGTVVPSSVRVVAVPDTIVRINPRWKGYRYFVYQEEIIIVEPRTLKIVAVLDV